MEHKFGRRFQNGCRPSYQLGNEFTVESYLEHQGQAFGERFDANSYLYITRAMDYFDAAARTEGCLEKALASVEAGIMLLSFSSDWLYPPKDAKEIAQALIANRKTVTYVNLPSIYGHDAFLLETEKIAPLISAFLEKRSESHD
jgi:homoserine O-acetyltransferase